MKKIPFDITKLDLKKYPHLKNVDSGWKTEKYIIFYDYINGFKHLRIRRIDNKPIHNYMDLQEIKNDIFGENVVAIEIYPNQNNFRNGSNTYHLWTWNDIENEMPNLNELYMYNN
ncbi:MAG: hypothetical protein ACFFDN_05020 [Candidatus Hodarchaeota archaeon]